jgi:hypothetical protein
MVRMEASLARLVRAGAITKAEALMPTHRPGEMERAIGAES